MDKGEIVEFLNDAFLHELVNAMTYMHNAFLMEESCPARRITEWVGIDEMRHMNWLGDLIVARGGRPRMDHRELDLGGKGTEASLRKQIELETEAVELYIEGIERCAIDPEVVGVLKHILDEEKRHRAEFRKLLEGL